jgi:hypothetical protein
LTQAEKVTVQGKLYAQSTLLYTTDVNNYENRNVITVDNVYKEGVSSALSVFSLKNLAIREGVTWYGDKSTLQFSITTENNPFDTNSYLVI